MASASGFCCDPFGVHFRKIRSGLRVVSVAQAKQLNLIPGKKLCTQCRKALYQKENESMELVEEDDSSYLDKSVAKDELNTSLTSLGCSPIKFVSQNKRVLYGKRKIVEATAATEERVADLLEVDRALLDKKTDGHCCQESSDLQKLMDMVRQKLQLADNHQQQISLLTLAPESWTIEKTMTYFSVSKRSVSTARSLKKSSGILADAKKKTGKTLDEETKANINSHYNSDEFSRMCPGKKEFVSVKVNGKREHVQKRLLLLNLKELHIEFIKRYNQKVGLSKFCQLRPKWCIPVGGASGLHSVCVCEYHQNFKLLTSQIPEIADYKDVLKKIVCSIDNRNCMLRSCSECPPSTNLEEFLRSKFTDTEESLTCYQWQKEKEKYCNMVQIIMSVDEFIEEVLKQAEKLCEHQFIKNSQAAYLNHLKETLPNDHALVLLDFAENYSFIIQDTIQGYHWNNSQSTLHPFVIYRKENESLSVESFCVVSSHMKHDSNAVHGFLQRITTVIKTDWPDLKKLIYFSDGAGSQYKNYKSFANLCHHFSDFNLAAEWHFFATSHGKSPCDGIGGTVKRLVANASLQSLGNPIDSAEKMFLWCQNNIKGVKFLFVSHDDVVNHVSEFDLEKRYESWSTVAGTRSYHMYNPTSLTTLEMRRVSFDEIVHNHGKQQPTSVKITDFPPGTYIACIYDASWFIGNVIETSEENNDLNVKFMTKSIRNCFNWPRRDDVCWIPLSHVLCKVATLAVQSAGARGYHLSDEELATVLLKSFKWEINCFLKE